MKPIKTNQKIMRMSDLPRGHFYSFEFEIRYGRRKMPIEVAVFNDVQSRANYMRLKSKADINSNAIIIIHYPKRRAIIGFIYGLDITPGTVAHECTHAVFALFGSFTYRHSTRGRCARSEEIFARKLGNLTNYCWSWLSRIKS